MNLSFTNEQATFRESVRAFAAKEVTRELLATTGGRIEEHVPHFYKQLAERGWIALHWPKEFGGEGRSPIDMAILYEEMGYARAPLGRHEASAGFVGESLIAYGSLDQQREYLPRIASGDLLCGWGLTEPGSGSDAASLRTTGYCDGDDYLVNGEKMFISGAHVADYILTVVRSAPRRERKHEGLSILLIPTSSPGVTVQPVHTIAGFRVNAVHFDDVRVPASQLVGQEGNGWAHVNTTMGFERSGGAMIIIGYLFRTLHEVLTWWKRHRTTAHSSDRHVLRLVRARRQLESARFAAYHAAWLYKEDSATLPDAATVKVMSSEASLEIAEAGMELIGSRSLVGEENGLPGLLEYVYRWAQYHITAGGSNDIQRNILAWHGLGLPRK